MIYPKWNRRSGRTRADPPFGAAHLTTGPARPRRRTDTAWGLRVANANCNRTGEAGHA
jgi:hypothetical protein